MASRWKCTGLVVPAGYDINHDFDNAGDAIILYAAALDGLELAKHLLEYGAYVNRHLQTGRYSVLAVPAKRANTSTADLLIDNGVAIDRSAAVTLAAELGRVVMMRCLIEHGANVYVMRIEFAYLPPNKDEEATALHKAAFAGHQEVVELLLEKDIKINIEDDIGRTAFMRAEEAGQAGIARLLRDKGAK